MAPSTVAFSLVALSAVAAALPATPASQGFSLQQVAVPKGVARHPAAHLAKAYSKYGAAVPSNVAAAAAATGSVTTTPGQGEEEYITKITVGDATLNIDIDTGSADLWAFSSLTPASERKGHNYYKPGSSSKKLEGYTWDISYGDGSSASGDVYTDTVKVGGVSFDKQAIEAATKASSEFTQNTEIDGLLGLAFSSINTVSPKPQKTFFDNVKDYLSKPIFGVLLKHGAPGVYDFGFTDDSKYTGEITYTDVDDSEGFWSFTADGYSVGSSSEDSVSASESVTGIADTGTTLLLDDSIVDAYYKKVDGAEYDSSQGGYVFPSSTTPPDLSFKIGGYTATVPGKYIAFASVGSDQIYGGLQSNSGIGLSIFGDVFLKSQYVVFDSEGPQIGFAAQK
ncbi:aspartic proteinase II-1 [Talaromyces proteolyticus]|uniref:Aspartic proteinase II-1 n=1 Tax=Talaromyces proteolyticus TaxID=1131652 RepID=A0AAD4KI42_9EURO|nr:aspartic proteinase II-1 [Talaromyces proteolyticus]KAH8688973.1 aspartic proteinase II-1 [Talaromyces proteolyticus]